MKNSLLLMLLTVFQVYANDTYSQNTTLSLDMNQVSVKSVLHEIENNSEFYFLYNSKLVDDNRKIDAHFEKQKVDEILARIFDGTDIDYFVIDRQIILSQEAYLAEAKYKLQPRTITGKVTEENGEPLIGVTVAVKGTTVGTITDINGNYEIQVVPEDEFLVFSFVGMKTMEASIAGKTTLSVVMEGATIGLEEVMVIGYGTQKRASVTGSVATLTAEELTRVPASNITQLLGGKLPGLTVLQSSGKPGADAANISVRGFGANNVGSTDALAQQNEYPLVIVDGVQREFIQMDPNEIESITILKDASAAVYGARAASGVILVTTKRGKIGKPVFTYNTTFSLQEDVNYPEYVSASELLNFFPDNDFGISDERKAGLLDGTIPSTDWRGVLLKKYAPMNQHNLNVQGGTEIVQYFISLGYLNQDTQWESGDFNFERFNITSNVDLKVSKSFSVALNLNWRRELRGEPTMDTGGDSETAALAIFDPVHPAGYPDPTKLPFVGASGRSPLALLNGDIGGASKTSSDVFNGALSLIYQVLRIEGLSAEAKLALRSNDFYQKSTNLKFSTYDYDQGTDIYSEVTTFGNNSLFERNDRDQRITTQFSLRYDRTFGNHTIGGLLLSETIWEDYRNFQAEGVDLFSTSLQYLNFVSSEGTKVSGFETQDGRNSVVGRVNYNFSDKYLLEASFRADASPRFQEDTRWGFFPGLSFGWRISNEPFMQQVGFITNLKLRGSAARLGNDNTNGRYDYLMGYKVLPPNPDSNGSALRAYWVLNGSAQPPIQTIGEANTLVTWQKSDLYNIGITASFLENKLGLELDVFYRERSQLLRELPSSDIPSTTGAQQPLVNVDSRNNRGIETVISYRTNIGNVGFNVAGNFTWNREKYVDYAEREFENEEDRQINQRSGQWVNRTFGYMFDGFFTQDDIDFIQDPNNDVINYDNNAGNPNGSLSAGDIRYIDINGDGVINSFDTKVIGKGDSPELLFGLNLGADWKGFDIRMFWQGAANFTHEFSSNERIARTERTSFKYIYDGTWTPETSSTAIFPSQFGNYDYNNRIIDYYLMDRTYIRLKNLSIGYTLPSNLTKKIGAERVRISLNGTNLLTFDAMGIFPFDPETTGRSAYPLQKVYTLGLILSF